MGINGGGGGTLTIFENTKSSKIYGVDRRDSC